ncbi:MAG: hypothetical protein C0425_09795 [Chlorobiaceae bacterium]|nr:hypothetical protein [Chlorobiaceae bacterium]MBA4310610.1 hypothetical protein [Chlorobiaceae bacterium]
MSLSKININPEKKTFFGLIISILIHLLILTFFALSDYNSFTGGGTNLRFEIETFNSSLATSELNEEKISSVNEAENILNEASGEKVLTGENILKSDEEKTQLENLGSSTITAPTRAKFGSGISIAESDTTKLSQIYSEKSLNVRIKFPQGWTFLDQDVRNKLDGVTFYYPVSSGIPPSVHFEVAEKFKFNPTRFTQKIEMNGFVAHFNDPTEMENHVSQTIYLRTETEEDYIVKLNTIGWESFNAYQPIFFGMIRTFRFGWKIF